LRADHFLKNEEKGSSWEGALTDGFYGEADVLRAHPENVLYSMRKMAYFDAFPPPLH